MKTLSACLAAWLLVLAGGTSYARDVTMTIGNPPPAHTNCSRVSCPPDTPNQVSCSNTCAGNPNCEKSGTTWYATLVCSDDAAGKGRPSKSPGKSPDKGSGKSPGKTSTYTIGNPPPANVTCATVSCPAAFPNRVSCENTCAGNPNCAKSGTTWYAALTCSE